MVRLSVALSLFFGPSSLHAMGHKLERIATLNADVFAL